MFADVAERDSVSKVDVPLSAVVLSDPVAFVGAALFGFSVARALVAWVSTAATELRPEESWEQIADVVIHPDRLRPWAVAEPYRE